MANDTKLVNLADLKEAFDNLNNNKKSIQAEVNSPTASGTEAAFIDTISQNAQGVITATKKTVRSASTSQAGLMSADDKVKLNGITAGATANTGTVTSVATGAGLTGGTITNSGTVKANLTSETKLTNAAADGTETSGRVYPVRLDKNGKLAVNVPWVDTNTQTITGVKGNAESSYRTGNVNLTPANIGALPLSGGTMTGSINMGTNASGSLGKAIAWTMSDGGNISIRPSSDLFQIVNTPSGGSAHNFLGIKADGSVSTSYGANWRTAIGAKATQSAVSSPTASGTEAAFIDTISQNAQGVITATKKSVTPASIGALTKEINRDTFSDLNNINLVGHTVLDNANWANMPPGLTSGTKWFDVYLFGYIQIAVGYSERPSLWVRTCTNSAWTSWYNMATRVKGNAESTYRTGDVNLTPANIGAVSKAGDTMTGALQVSANITPFFRGTRTDSREASIYLENDTAGWALGVAAWGMAGAFVIGQYSGTGSSNWRLKIDNDGIVNLSKPLPLGSGGTGATTAAAARANLGITPPNIGATRYITLTATTAPTIYPVLNVLGTGEAAVIHMSAKAFEALTIDKPDGGTRSISYVAVSGIVYRMDSDSFAFDISRSTGIRRWAFLTTVTSSKLLTDNVYTYGGTEVT